MIQFSQLLPEAPDPTVWAEGKFAKRPSGPEPP